MTISFNFICFEIEKIKLALVEAFLDPLLFCTGNKIQNSLQWSHFRTISDHLIDSVANSSITSQVCSVPQQ